MNKTVIDRLPLSKRQKEALRKARITQTLIADAIAQRDRLTPDEKARYVEIIIERQPQLAGTIVVLKRLGVNEVAMEPLADLLLMVPLPWKMPGLNYFRPAKLWWIFAMNG